MCYHSKVCNINIFPLSTCREGADVMTLITVYFVEGKLKEFKVIAIVYKHAGTL